MVPNWSSGGLFANKCMASECDWHWCGTHSSSPSRSPIATLTASSSSLMPHKWRNGQGIKPVPAVLWRCCQKRGPLKSWAQTAIASRRSAWMLGLLLLSLLLLLHLIRVIIIIQRFRVIIIIIIQRQLVRRRNMAWVTTRAPINVKTTLLDAVRQSRRH